MQYCNVMVIIAYLNSGTGCPRNMYTYPQAFHNCFKEKFGVKVKLYIPYCTLFKLMVLCEYDD